MTDAAITLRRSFLTAFAVLGIAALIVSPALALMLYYLLNDDSPPFSVGKTTTFNLNSQPERTFRAGDSLIVSRYLCSRVTAPIDTGRRLIRVADNAYFVLPSSSGMVRKECGTAINVLTLPAVLTPGAYRYSVVIQYQTNNPFRPEGVFEFPPPEIEIIK